MSEHRIIPQQIVDYGAYLRRQEREGSTIMLPGKLCRRLLAYARQQKSPPARCSSPEAERACPESRFGRR